MNFHTLRDELTPLYRRQPTANLAALIRLHDAIYVEPREAEAHFAAVDAAGDVLMGRRVGCWAVFRLGEIGRGWV